MRAVAIDERPRFDPTLVLDSNVEFLDGASDGRVSIQCWIPFRSGSLIVGLRSRSTHGPETWTWVLAGVALRDGEVVGAVDLLGGTRSDRAVATRDEAWDAAR